MLGNPSFLPICCATHLIFHPYIWKKPTQHLPFKFQAQLSAYVQLQLLLEPNPHPTPIRSKHDTPKVPTVSKQSPLAINLQTFDATVNMHFRPILGCSQLFTSIFQVLGIVLFQSRFFGCYSFPTFLFDKKGTNFFAKLWSFISHFFNPLELDLTPTDVSVFVHCTFILFYGCNLFLLFFCYVGDLSTRYINFLLSF